MKKNLLFFLFLLTVGGTHASLAQKHTAHFLANTGYVHHKNFHAGELGARVLFLRQDNIMYRLGISALMGKYSTGFTVMPKGSADILLNFQKGRDLSHSHYYILGVEATNHFITPKIGAALLGILEVNAGYMMPYEKNLSRPEGITVHVGVSIPLVVFE